MAEGISKLEETINNFERLLQEMRDETREAHAVLKQLRITQREIEKLITTDVKNLIDDEVNKIVKEELDKIAPRLREQTSAIYDRVGNQVDKLIQISLGREFSATRNGSDLRPQLARHLREWIMEIITEEGLNDGSL
jgi:transposase-like protein